MKKHKDIREQLRQAIANCGLTGNQLAILSGLSRPIIHHFMHGHRSITLDTAAKLAQALGMEFTPPERKG